MQRITETPAGAVEPPHHWMVELNIAGCRIRRWATRRRHLLGLNPETFTPPRS